MVQALLPHLPHLRFVLPSAPSRPVTLNGGYVMPAWYDIESLTTSRAHHACEGLEGSAAYIGKLMTEEVLAGVPHSRQAVTGFSQGGALALFTGLLAAPPVAGVGCLSGYLPRAEEVVATLPPSAVHTPVWFGHGEADDVVLPAWGAESADAVRAMGVKDVAWSTYRHVGHEVHPEELAAFAAWLGGVLPDDVQAPAVAAAAEAQAASQGLRQPAALPQ